VHHARARSGFRPTRIGRELSGTGIFGMLRKRCAFLRGGLALHLIGTGLS
jgi:hypothetical protein